MLVLNGKKFAANDAEFIEALFHRGGTCVGYYKARKTGVDLMDMQKNKIGVITKHRVMAKATKQPNGKFWYSYGDIDIIGRYNSYSVQCKDIAATLHRFNIA